MGEDVALCRSGLCLLVGDGFLRIEAGGDGSLIGLFDGLLDLGAERKGDVRPLLDATAMGFDFETDLSRNVGISVTLYLAIERSGDPDILEIMRSSICYLIGEGD